jgi:hypothetical protein
LFPAQYPFHSMRVWTDASIDRGVEIYALGVNPGLVWCGNEAGGLHLRNGGFPLVQRLEEDALHASKTP